MILPVNKIQLKHDCLSHDDCDLYNPETGEKITFTNKGYCLIEKDGKTYTKYRDSYIEEVFTDETKTEILPNGRIVINRHIKLPKSDKH